MVDNRCDLLGTKTRTLVIYALCKYEFFVLYPVNPQTVSNYRQAFTRSRAKDDPTDIAPSVGLGKSILSSSETSWKNASSGDSGTSSGFAFCFVAGKTEFRMMKLSICWHCVRKVHHSHNKSFHKYEHDIHHLVNCNDEKIEGLAFNSRNAKAIKLRIARLLCLHLGWQQ